MSAEVGKTFLVNFKCKIFKLVNNFTAKILKSYQILWYIKNSAMLKNPKILKTTFPKSFKTFKPPKTVFQLIFQFMFQKSGTSFHLN